MEREWTQCPCGIKESRFYYWKKRIEDGDSLPSPTGGFIPVKLNGKFYPFPTDMRKSFYSLSGIVLNEMHQDIQQGDAFSLSAVPSPV